MTEVSLADRQQAEALLVAFINEILPKINTRKGTAFRSLIIDAAAVTYAKIRQEGTDLRTSLNINNIASSGFDESVIEAFIDNFLLTRNEGSYSQGIMRVDVSTNKTYTVTTDVVFETDTVSFIPLSNEIYEVDGEDNGNSNLYTDPETGLYFLLVPVQSTTVTSEVVQQSTVFTLQAGSFIDQNFLQASAYLDFSQGSDKESLAEYQARAQESLTVRDLVTQKSIQTVIPENFGNVSSIRTIGYGDVEMLRDLVFPHGVHKGGDVDIFVRPDVLPQTVTLEKIVVSNLEVELTAPDTPLYKVISIEERVGSTLTLLEEGTDYEISFSSEDFGLRSFAGSPVPNYYSRFSNKEIIKIRFLNQRFINSRVVITAYKPSSIENMQVYVDADDNRVVSSDLLVRALAPVFVSAEVTYRIESSDKAPDQANLLSTIMSYVNGLAKDETVQVSKIVDLVQSFEGVVGVQLPLTITAEVNKTDGSVETISTEDKLVIPTEQSIGFSQRICQYILRAEDLTFNVVIND